MNLVRRVFFLVWCVAGTTAALAQDLSQHNWYFGNSNKGIRFNRSTNKPSLITNKATPFGMGGSFVATDPSTGDLLFYTDGNTVYDITNTPMPNGGGLAGLNSANQPVVGCLIPGDSLKYLIFTNNTDYTTAGSISVTTVDMSQFGNAVFPSPPFGDVVNPKNVPFAGLVARSEGMTIVPHGNGTDAWLITHQNNSPNYSATLINAASVASGTFTTMNTTVGTFPITVANFAYNPVNKKMAVSPQDPSTDALILNFDNTTGTFAFDSYILNSGKPTVGNQSIYDIEWDRAGQYLYLSRFGDASNPADLLQYDYKNPGITLTSILGTPVFRSYGLQFGPDSVMYYLYQATAGGPYLVDTFTKTDTIASQVKRNTTPLASTSFEGMQFPQFMPKSKPNLKVDFTSVGTCQNNPTTFYPVVSPNADSLRWDFGDGGDTTLWSPIHTYAMAQTYNVKLTAYYRGDSAVVTHPVTIQAFTIKLNLVQDTTACRQEFPPPRGSSSPKQFSVKVKATGGTPTYAWSNGDLGDTLTPDSAGYYFVVATDASGCSTYAGVNVKEYGLQDQRRNIWYFGNHAGIDFTPTPPKALSSSAMDAPEGCAIVCDRNAKVLFYTDGDQVWDRTNSPIASGIGGDPASTQSALIIGVPGDETLYYIFTTQAINGTEQYELKFSLFDLKQNSGKGAVTQQNVLLFSKSTERITGNARWLIAHEYGNNTFRAYPITAEGIGDPVYSAVGSDHSFQYQANGEGYMKLGAKNSIAVALSTPGTSNIVELFHLNDSTGVIGGYHKIDLGDPAGQVYGVEFSPGGNKVFASITGTPTPSKLFEYSIDSLDRPHFKQVLNVPAQLGAIQLAPNNQVMVAVNDGGHNGFLGTIAANDDTTKLSSFQLNGFALAPGTNSWLGLPNFTQQVSNAFGGPGFTYTGVCLGDSTHFTGTATDPIDKFQWFFGDGGSSTQPSPAHLYATAGTFTVSMHLTNRCHLDTTIVQKVTIFAPPPPPTVPPASALCNGPVVLNANTGNLPGMTYLWTNGDTTKIVTLNQPAFISVTNTDQHGCHSTAQAIVADNRPQVDITPDQVLCQNVATPVLDALNPGATFVWTINGVNASTIQTQAVDTSVPGVYNYKVVVTDPITTCTATSQKTFTVNVSPTFTMTGTNPSSCGTANGTVTLQLNTSAPPGGPYEYFITGANRFNQQGIDNPAPLTIGPLAGASAGVVTAIVRDQVSFCTTSSSIGLTDATFTASATVLAPNCDPVTIQLQILTGAPTFPLSYVITNNSTGVTAASGSMPSSPFSVAMPSQGPNPVQYTIAIKDASVPGCTFAINNFPVTPAAQANFTLVPSLCASPPTIAASGATTYTWTSNVAGAIVGPANGSAIQLQPGLGPVTYTAVGSTAGSCPGTQNITVNVIAPLTPTFTAGDPCDTQVLLTASPIGNYIYRWYLDVGGSLQTTPLVGRQVFVTATGNYAVELSDPVTGCKYTSSPSQTVSVNGNLSVTLSATPACDDNKPFTITAIANTAGVSYTWFFNNSPIANESQNTISPTAAGIYKVTVIRGPCTTSSQIQIIKAPIPVGLLPTDAVICNDPDNHDPTTQKVALDPGPFIRYYWYKNQLSLNDTTRVYTADSEGTYAVDLTNSFGCVASDQTIVRNECLPKVIAPTAFHPTGNVAENRDFYVFSFFITDNFQIFIYNRWGELVYQSSDRHFKWNGNFNNSGQPMPSGTYAYVIKYVSSFEPQQGIQEKHGGVVLLR